MSFLRSPVPRVAAPAWRLLAASVAVLLAACSSVPTPKLAVAPADAAAQRQWLDRVSWGATADDARQVASVGVPRWLGAQLHPGPGAMPAAAQAQIDAMRISRTPLGQLVRELEDQRKAADALAGDDAKKAARQAYQQALNQLAREAQQRFLLRALYSPNQLQEQMTWFWMNHFNVSTRKANLRALIGDYEETAVRPHALGRFRDLLGATLRHPAMLRYLDNAQNAANRLNENYARELMELHTLGIGGGYSQDDVQALARVLTGVGVSPREGLFEFNPARHDIGPKTLLGTPITQRGLAEVDEALDRLARAPATARFISNKLAVYFVADVPPPALVERMSATFQRSDGDIAAVLTTMFEAPEFAASLGQKFRDPVHYVVGSVRLAYGGRVVVTVDPMIGWINRMGQTLYAHETPDGYPLTQDAWASAGQMTTRFEIARALGANGAVLFRGDNQAPLEKPPFPPLAESAPVRDGLPALSSATRQALARAATPQDWNTFYLASPEHNHR
ncbi:DUF1800 domain-containing protein [Variovorax sp. ZT4R33]|uniref:DUF1800 domain-containing protein n=1 Tax=Variovorax sp. ZT4R33 TaxID=3443743 RepID=UPI003F471970